MSVTSASSCSATSPASGPWRLGPWLRVRGWELNPALLGFSFSPCRGGFGCSGSGWGGEGRRGSVGDPAGDGGIEEHRLRLSHRAPQFCSHCSRTLRVRASFTSSPQLSKMFTSSTYGPLGNRSWKWIISTMTATFSLAAEHRLCLM